jgi:hypothetical protein
VFKDPGNVESHPQISTLTHLLTMYIGGVDGVPVLSPSLSSLVAEWKRIPELFPDLVNSALTVPHSLTHSCLARFLLVVAYAVVNSSVSMIYCPRVLVASIYADTR